jgi:hypothetical protein
MNAYLNTSVDEFFSVDINTISDKIFIQLVCQLFLKNTNIKKL